MRNDTWVLIGGLMVQAHGLAHGIQAVRPTQDLDVILRIEIQLRVVTDFDLQLRELGYELQAPPDARSKSSVHYRYRRTSELGDDVVDVMVPDHAGKPGSYPRLRARPMFKVEGGTQAVSRAMVYSIGRRGEKALEISVPDELGALVLKGAAYAKDMRDRDRHLEDAAVLAACITDHAAEVRRLKGSDRKRICSLYEVLKDPNHPAWLLLSSAEQQLGQDTLRILAVP